MLIVVLLCMSCACSASPIVNAPTGTSVSATQPAAQTTTQPQTSGSPPATTAGKTPVSPYTDNCSLLNSQDLASLYSSAEVVLPKPQISQVNQPAFGTQTISATETACAYYVYHLPGTKDMQMLQVNVWVDASDQASSETWGKMGEDASAQAQQVISGIGDKAFFENGKLTFFKDHVYVTIEVVGTAFNPNTNAGLQQQIAIEEQLARKALNHF